MTKLKFISAFLIIALYACGQNPARHKVDPTAIQLNNQAMALADFPDNADSSKKAISLLDKAIKIDSNYFLAYSNILIFYYQLKQFDKALQTNNKMIQLRPNAYYLYTRSGLLYFQLGDTANSNPYFYKSLAICSSVLDTMSSKNRSFVMLKINQAINLIMLNDSSKANKVLKDLYHNQTDNPEHKNAEKKYIQSFMNKNKTELIDFFSNPKKYSH